MLAKNNIGKRVRRAIETMPRSQYCETRNYYYFDTLSRKAEIETKESNESYPAHSPDNNSNVSSHQLRWNLRYELAINSGNPFNHPGKTHKKARQSIKKANSLR